MAGVRPLKCQFLNLGGSDGLDSSREDFKSITIDSMPVWTVSMV